MDLNQTQRLLARLFTDRQFRERFFADPQLAGDELGLTPGEVHQLLALSNTEVSAFAQTLHRKRLAEIRRLLPLTCRAIGPGLDELFARHASAFHPSGSRRDLADAHEFAVFLGKVDSVPRHLAELAAYESIWLRFRGGRHWLQIAWFGSDPRDAWRRRAGPARLAPRRGTLALWFRFAGRVRHLLVAWPPASLTASAAVVNLSGVPTVDAACAAGISEIPIEKDPPCIRN